MLYLSAHSLHPTQHWVLCSLLFLAHPSVASFLPHFLSFDCCLVTFSQKFCLLSGRVKRHSLQSLLSHLAHSVASPVGLVNQLVSSLAIMKYPFHMFFQFHYIFVSFLRVPSSVLPSSVLPFIVISYHLCQAGWYPALPAHLLTPTQSAPSFLALLLEGERCGVFGSEKFASAALL